MSASVCVVCLSSCMEVIWSQSSVSFRTGCRSSRCIKGDQVLRTTTRMKRRGWWENTRYCGWRAVCLSICLSVTLQWNVHYSILSIPRAPSWFIPLIKETKKTLRVRSPMEFPKIHQSKSWSESTSLRYLPLYPSTACLCLLLTWTTFYNFTLLLHSRELLQSWELVKPFSAALRVNWVWTN